MRVLIVLIFFVRTRRWLLAAVLLTLTILGLIHSMPVPPEAVHEAQAERETFVFDEVTSHPIRTASYEVEARTGYRGAWLTGTIEEPTIESAVRLTDKTDE